MPQPQPQTLPAVTTVNPAARDAAAGLRRLLADLGADAALVSRVQGWTDITETVPYVYVPPLPAALVEHLARLLPARAVS